MFYYNIYRTLMILGNYNNLSARPLPAGRGMEPFEFLLDSVTHAYLVSGAILKQFFFCDPVVSELICYRTRAKRLIIDSKTTGELRKIWTGFVS